jgi:hypothetical protein
MFEQFSSLTVKVAFQMKHEGHGRAVVAKIGDKFLVTNPKHMQDKGIKIMRAKLARLNEGYLLSFEQINQLFTVEQ